MIDAPYAASTYSADPASTGPLFTFQTPTVNDIPNYLPTDRGPAVSLLRHYRPKTRGVNVFVLSDNTVVQDTATAENSNTSYPLPWILNDPSGPFAYTTNWDLTIQTASLPVWIQYVYYGSHVYTINQFEATFLSNAGYGNLIHAL